MVGMRVGMVQRWEVVMHVLRRGCIVDDGSGSRGLE